MALFTSGVTDLVSSQKGDNSNLVKAYNAYIESAFPFAEKTRDQTDQKMVEAMKKEAEKGVIQFSPMPQSMTPLHSKAKQMSLPDDFRTKLRERSRRR